MLQLLRFQGDTFVLSQISVHIYSTLFFAGFFSFYCLGVCVLTTGEELWSDGGNELALEGLWIRALCVFDRNVPFFDPTQQPQKVAVTQQKRCLEVPRDV